MNSSVKTRIHLIPSPHIGLADLFEEANHLHHVFLLTSAENAVGSINTLSILGFVA